MRGLFWMLYGQFCGIDELGEARNLFYFMELNYAPFVVCHA